MTGSTAPSSIGLGILTEFSEIAHRIAPPQQALAGPSDTPPIAAEPGSARQQDERHDRQYEDERGDRIAEQRREDANPVERSQAP